MSSLLLIAVHSMAVVASFHQSITLSAKAGNFSRYIQSEGFGSLDVEDELEFRRLHDWQVGRFFALQASFAKLM
jgi:hypothetical protein